MTSLLLSCQLEHGRVTHPVARFSDFKAMDQGGGCCCCCCVAAAIAPSLSTLCLPAWPTTGHCTGLTFTLHLLYSSFPGKLAVLILILYPHQIQSTPFWSSSRAPLDP